MSPAKASRFKTVQKFKSDFSQNEFVLYESERTGMRVVVVDQKGPKVYGYFAVATEIHDDSGAPHTLEHLVFMGSRSYKYKGLLDKLATRAYSGTNAWTDTDQTVYTLDTAGWAGFAQILPVYLEHVLLPTLTDAGCLTEVHHIDGTGHDAGVVYSEMQGVQNEMDSLLDLQARRQLYSKQNAFRSETGGLMEQLRVLTADRIRDFHKEMYQPKNLCVALIGEVDHPHLLEILDTFEDSIKDEVPRLDEPFDRPWTKTGKTTALQGSILDEVEFPESDESTGQIMIGFLGPDYNDNLLTQAIDILLVYLCGSSVSLLENVLVEKEQLASAVYYSTSNRPDMIIWFQLGGVETDKLKATEKRFFEVLNSAVDKPLDMPYLIDCLQRARRQVKSAVESSGNFFATALIEDHLFGNRDGSTLRDVATMEELDILEGWKEDQWREVVRKYLVDGHHVSTLGIPSKKLQKKNTKDEQARVKAQQEKLGPEGLKKAGVRLEEAKAENDKPIPDEVIRQFKIPGPETIHFIPTVTARSGLARRMGNLDNEVQHRIDQDKTDLPTFMHFEHIPSNFVKINMYMCTHQLPEELRPLLPLFLQNFFDTPVLRNGVRLEFEEVVVQLEKDTVSYELGTGGPGSEMLRLRFSVEPEKYETAISWIRDLLLHNIFDATRLKATLAKILADIPEEKRSGSSMAAAVVNMIHYSRSSSSRAQNTLVKAVCLKRAMVLLKKEPAALIAKLEAIRTHLAHPANIRILILADLLSGKLPTPVFSWTPFTSALPPFSDPSKPDLNPLDDIRSTLSPAGTHPGSLNYVIPLSTIDSSYGRLNTLFPDSYSHPDLPAATVALEYLNAVEGPMWVAVRGTGLAYGASFGWGVETGRLSFQIYRSPDARKAYAVSRKVVQDLAEGKEELNEFGLEGAVSSIIVGFADAQPTMGAAAMVSFVNQVFKGVEKDWMVGFMAKVRGVTPEQVREAMKKWILPCFEPGKADLVVACAGIMEGKLVEGFKEEGFSPEARKLNDFVDDYGMEADDLVNADAMEEDASEDESESATNGSDEEDGAAGSEDGSEVDSEGDGMQRNELNMPSPAGCSAENQPPKSSQSPSDIQDDLSGTRDKATFIGPLPPSQAETGSLEYDLLNCPHRVEDFPTVHCRKHKQVVFDDRACGCPRTPNSTPVHQNSTLPGSADADAKTVTIVSNTRPTFQFCGSFDGSQPAARWLKRFEWEIKALADREGRVAPRPWLKGVEVCLIGQAQEWAETNDDARIVFALEAPRRSTVIAFTKLLQAEYPLQVPDLELTPAIMFHTQYAGESLQVYYQRTVELLRKAGGRDRTDEQTWLSRLELTVLDMIIRAFIMGLDNKGLARAISSAVITPSRSVNGTYAAALRVMETAKATAIAARQATQMDRAMEAAQAFQSGPLHNRYVSLPLRPSQAAQERASSQHSRASSQQDWAPSQEVQVSSQDAGLSSQDARSISQQGWTPSQDARVSSQLRQVSSRQSWPPVSPDSLTDVPQNEDTVDENMGTAPQLQAECHARGVTRQNEHAARQVTLPEPVYNRSPSLPSGPPQVRRSSPRNRMRPLRGWPPISPNTPRFMPQIPGATRASLLPPPGPGAPNQHASAQQVQAAQARAVVDARNAELARSIFSEEVLNMEWTTGPSNDA